MLRTIESRRLIIAIAMIWSCDSGPVTSVVSKCGASVFYEATTMTATLAIPSCDENANADLFVFNRTSGGGVERRTVGDDGTLLNFSANIGDEVVVTLSTNEQLISSCFVLVDGLVASSICDR